MFTYINVQSQTQNLTIVGNVKTIEKDEVTEISIGYKVNRDSMEQWVFIPYSQGIYTRDNSFVIAGLENGYYIIRFETESAKHYLYINIDVSIPSIVYSTVKMKSPHVLIDVTDDKIERYYILE